MARRGQIFLAGLRPAPPDPWPGTGCAGGCHSGVVWARSVPSSLDEIHKIVLSIGKLKELPVLLIRHVYSFMSSEFMKSKEILGVATMPLNRRLKMKNDNRYHRVFTSTWTGTLRQLRQWHLARRLGFRSLRAIERVYDPMDHYPTNWV